MYSVKMWISASFFHAQENYERKFSRFSSGSFDQCLIVYEVYLTNSLTMFYVPFGGMCTPGSDSWVWIVTDYISRNILSSEWSDLCSHCVSWESGIKLAYRKLSLCNAPVFNHTFLISEHCQSLDFYCLGQTYYLKFYCTGWSETVEFHSTLLEDNLIIIIIIIISYCNWVFTQWQQSYTSTDTTIQ
jgi:hypothetical protein